MEDRKKKMVRKEPMENNNSIFNLDALVVTDVWEANTFETVKYEYNIQEKKLTVFGDVESIYVHYKR